MLGDIVLGDWDEWRVTFEATAEWVSVTVEVECLDHLAYLAFRPIVVDEQGVKSAAG